MAIPKTIDTMSMAESLPLPSSRPRAESGPRHTDVVKMTPGLRAGLAGGYVRATAAGSGTSMGSNGSMRSSRPRTEVSS